MFSLGALKSLKPYIRPFRNWMYFSLAMAIPLALLRNSQLLFVKYFVDEILTKKDPSKLLLIPIGFILINIANVFVRFAHYYSMRIVVVNVNQKVREKVYQHMLSLSTDFFTKEKAGTFLSRVTADPWHLDQGISALNVVVREPISFVALLGYAFYKNWKLTILTFTIAPLLAILFGKTGKYIKRKIADYQEKNGESYSIVQEAISGIRIIHHFNLEGTMIAKFSKQMTDITKVLLKISKMEEIASPLVELITAIAMALILYFGGRSVLSNDMTAGDLMAFFTAFGLMINPIRQVSDVNSKLNSAAAAMERINEFLSWDPKIKSKPGALPIRSITGSIEFKNMGFAYPDSPDRKVLNDVSFSLPLGKTVALVGQSGSGKSSIVQLLTRLYDVNTGTIEIDGVNIKDLEVPAWRDLVAVVSQDVFLFHDTIYENILMGRPRATQEEVMEAARKAFAFEFINGLPEGFATVVGDRGVKLSGGERQRISIARAFLKDAQCLILDEATSNLDNESEKIVQKSLENLMAHRPTLVIAHRLSTIQNADQIIVLKQGVIQESGNYQELIQKSGEFERLVSFAKHA
jgi:subfamily B ATP-binding cassette protein MsbA